ncbi:uncharacterized protein [Arachis hypogaea]|uniref:uncharacterized protein n=1 Tax=Arachis hypogaea TaxID=3818 RepID=UPI003B2110A5|nr:uncharacterized protein DS421_8g240500 [Arachis hypogaea]
MDPNKKSEEAAVTSEMDKGKMAASSEEPAPTLDMDISEEEESSEEEPASSEEETVNAAEIEARLIAESVFQEKVAELAAIRMQARNLAEQSRIGLKVLTELRDKTMGEAIKLNRPPLKNDKDKDKDKDK